MFPFTKSGIIVRIFLVARYNEIAKCVDLPSVPAVPATLR